MLLTDITINDTEGNPRTITRANVLWMLGAGWLSYLISMLLNILYYAIHPSSPELGTWGMAEEIEEWKPRVEREA